MKLAKFKLIAGGLGGISITCVEYIMAKNNVVFTDDVTRIRKVPFPHKFRQSVSRLKYYFLVLTSHWIEPFNKYYNLGTHVVAPLPSEGSVPMGHALLIDIMNKTNITGVVFTGKGFLITGTIDSYGDKPIGISTRLVTEEDDAGFYNEAIGLINSIFSDIGIFFKDGKVLDDSPRTYLEDLGYKDKEDLGNLSDEELTNRVLDAFQQRGGILLMPEDGSSIAIDNASSKDIKVSLDDKGENVVLDTRTGNIDGKHLQEVTEKEANIDPERPVEEIKKEKHASISSEEKTNKKSKSTDNDREFPPEGISDDDIKDAIGATAEDIPEEVIPTTKVKKKKAGSTLASEKDFAAATGNEAPEDVPVDLISAEFSENQSPEVDDWNQENQTEESGISQEDLNSAIQE